MNTTQEQASRPAAPPARLFSRPLALGLTAVMAVVSVVVRLIPYHLRPPNVAANGSMSLFGGARLPLWQALPLALVPMVVSDLLLLKLFGWEPFNPAVYACYVVAVLSGRAALRGNDSSVRIGAVMLANCMLFYLVTNAAYWWTQFGTSYQEFDRSPAGLLACYVKALPYFGFSLAGDLGFAAVLFGAEAWLYGLLYGTRPAEAPEEVVS